MGSGLRLVTANAASGRDARGRHDMASWARAVGALDADVVAVQEVDHRLPRSGELDQTAAVAEAVGAADARFLAAVTGTPGSREVAPATGGHDAAPGPSYGVALASRLPVEAWHTRRMRGSRARLPVLLPPGAERRVLWAADEPRVALGATVRTPSGPLTVVTTHLSFSPPRAVAQLREAAAWARGLPGPVVLLGDLNLPGRAPAWLSGWRAAGAHPTFPAHRARVQLDHALLRPDDDRVRVVGSAARRVAGSDHLALVVDVAVEAAR